MFLDLDRWPRRAAWEHFRRFEHPCFDVCTRVDAARLKPALAGAGFMLGCYHLALSIANAIEPFRYRIDGDRVRVHPRVDGSTTVLRADGGLGFATLRHDADWRRFAADGRAAIAAARTTPTDGSPLFPPPPDDGAALVYFTALPWVHFTSFAHARQPGVDDTVPKIAFGRADADGARLLLPLSVQVHHALMDGVEVGRFVQRFEQALLEPDAWFPVSA